MRYPNYTLKPMPARLICFCILALILSSCIQRFEPEIKSSDATKYVVTGGVNRGDSIQRVSISTASLLRMPKFVPIVSCNVRIIDAKGNEYKGRDMLDGTYEFKIPDTELIPGNSFRVDITVPSGAHIVSDFDQLNDGPPIDSLYYQLEDIPTSNPLNPIRGIQFYVDFDGTNYACRNYRVEATETWEYTAKYYEVREGAVCWLTVNVRNIFTISTENQTQNAYRKSALNFVDNYSSQRLRYMYSLLVSQYSLSDAAYAYWNKVKINTLDQGGLYENQPFKIAGNLHNVSNPSQEVLGFFGASTRTTKRIFVGAVPGLPIQFVDCRPLTEKGEVHNPECVDCRNKVGGTNKKPDFWPY